MAPSLVLRKLAQNANAGLAVAASRFAQKRTAGAQ